MKCVNKVEIIKAFIYGSCSYLIGGLASLPFEWIRGNTMLLPRVSLIAVGVGGFILGFLINGRKRESVGKFSIVAITSYLTVIFINFISISISLGQEFSTAILVWRILIPAIVYSLAFGIQMYGISSATLFITASTLAALPFSLATLFFHLSNTKPLEPESLWMFVSMGAAVAVSIRSIEMRKSHRGTRRKEA